MIKGTNATSPGPGLGSNNAGGDNSEAATNHENDIKSKGLPASPAAPSTNTLQAPISSGSSSQQINSKPTRPLYQGSSSSAAYYGKKSPKDFIFGRVIGEGSFSMVCLATDLERKKKFAIKICEKSHITREKKEKAIMREKNIMNTINEHPNPFFIKLYCTFQDVERLYFVMNYAQNGELLKYINKYSSFDEECTRFYAGETLIALEHMHKLGIIHRDLKPENILLNEKWHIQISDFGSACFVKDLVSNQQQQSDSVKERSVTYQNESDRRTGRNMRKNSFVGTAQYVSPEMLTDKRSIFSSDLWAFGCIIYQMVSGAPPFRAPNEYLIFQKIINLDYEFPQLFNETAKDLVQKLIKLDPDERLGAKDNLQADGYNSIRSHSFFEPLKDRWQSLHLEEPPRIGPYTKCSNNEELRSDLIGPGRDPFDHMPDDIEPGLDERQMSRLLGLALHDETPPERSSQSVQSHRHILDIPEQEFSERLKEQSAKHPYHSFVENNLVLKEGLLDKRVGLFARRRMFLLTTGPHLYYVDPVNMVLKGQVPLNPDTRVEGKNFQHFFIHTPNRTYYLEDPASGAPSWCQAIDEVLRYSFHKKAS